MIPALQTGGLSHSEIRASKVICTYTQLIAAYHVLHRLCEPRHPPCALHYFLLANKPHQKPNYHNTQKGKAKNKEKEKARSPYFQLYCLKNKNIAVYILIYSLACVNMSKNGGQKGTKHIIICYPLSEVENNGFEPLTPCLQSRCSSQLS